MNINTSTRKQKMTYKGKYPYHIKSVYSLTGTSRLIGVTTNNGERYQVEASKENNYEMPEPGQSIFDQQNWTLVSPTAKKA